MIIKKCTYYIFLLVFFLTATISLTAQTVGTRTDKNQILIGERIEYELLLSLPEQGYKVYFDLPDSVTHFDIIEKGKFDTSNNSNAWSLRRKIIFTSFDSGRWYIPSLPVTLEKNNDSKRYMTDSVLINVGYAVPDSTNALRDIKPIMEVNTKNYFWYFIIAAFLLVLAGAAAIMHFLRKPRKPLPVLHSSLSPYNQAMNDLKILSGYKLELPAEVKKYHSELSFIFKRYYSRKIRVSLLNTTTDDLLINLNEQKEATTLIASVAEVLRMGDAVKFAKYIPPVSESGNCLERIKQAIETLDANKQNTT